MTATDGIVYSQRPSSSHDGEITIMETVNGRERLVCRTPRADIAAKICKNGLGPSVVPKLPNPLRLATGQVWNLFDDRTGKERDIFVIGITPNGIQGFKTESLEAAKRAPLGNLGYCYLNFGSADKANTLLPTEINSYWFAQGNYLGSVFDK